MSPNERTESDTSCTSMPLICISELMERCMGSAAVAQLLLNKLEQQLRMDAEALAAQCAVCNVDQVSRIAHGLKGAAGAVAAAPLREAAAALEQRARHNQLGNAAEELHSLQTEIDRCLQQLPTVRASIATRAGGSSRGAT